MKAREIPALARRFKFEGSEDLYVLVTPRCWPSPIGDRSPRPALYMQRLPRRGPEGGKDLEPVLTLKVPTLEPWFVEGWLMFAEAETEDERTRALEILENLIAWHGREENRR